MTQSIAARFWPRVDKTDGCWNWLAAKNNNGYGAFTAFLPSGRCTNAHRVAYELSVGPIPVGMTLDHLCRNRACVNPAHLEPVPHRVNTLRGDGPSARNARQTLCKRGLHELQYRSNGTRYCSPCQAEAARRRKTLSSS